MSFPSGRPASGGPRHIPDIPPRTPLYRVLEKSDFPRISRDGRNTEASTIELFQLRAGTTRAIGTGRRTMNSHSIGRLNRRRRTWF
jgi:hypothetical protein